MNIFYEGTIFSRSMGQPFGGISRYFQRLIERLPAEHTPWLSLLGRNDGFAPRHPRLRTLQLQTSRYRPWRLFSPLEKWLCRHHERWVPHAIQHPTYYNGLDGQPLRRQKGALVVTVYDMIHELFPQEFPGAAQFLETKRQAILAADVVICISEKTKADVLELVKIPADRLKVIYLAADQPVKSPAESSPVTQDPPYLLYVGQRRSRYKNFALLLQAFAQVAPAERDLHLYVAGPAWTEEEKRTLAQLPGSSRIRLIPEPDDQTIDRLYRHSQALVYPSRYEGFGLPPVEAMQAGTAVISSNGGSLPEVVGTAGLTFNPDSLDELTGCINQLLHSPGLRSRLIQQGFSQAAKFSWDQTADQTMQLYKAIA
jgi:glycosyltransferase involved in cell wall biosynthesis